jgi:hypothetical protein
MAVDENGGDRDRSVGHEIHQITHDRRAKDCRCQHSLLITIWQSTPNRLPHSIGLVDLVVKPSGAGVDLQSLKHATLVGVQLTEPE